MYHHVLPTAAKHLEGAGGDLQGMTVSAGVFAACWPLNTLLAPPRETVPGRISLGDVLQAVDAHRAHLRRVTTQVMEGHAAGDVLAVFGTAFEASHPSYNHRQQNDVDLFTRDARTGIRLVDDLADRLGFRLARFRTSHHEEGRLAHFKLIREQGGHQLHVDVIGGGRPVGPGLLPPFHHPPLFERARPSPTGDLGVPVASVEDMLLLLAEKVRRKSSFRLRDVNDAQVLLTGSTGGLDWEYLGDSCRHHAVGGALHRLVVEAERGERRALGDRRSLAAMAPASAERRVIAILAGARAFAGFPAGAPTEDHLHRASRRWRRMWFLHFVRRDVRTVRDAVRLVGDHLRHAALKLQLRTAARAMARRIERLDPSIPRSAVVSVTTRRIRGRVGNS